MNIYIVIRSMQNHVSLSNYQQFCISALETLWFDTFLRLHEFRLTQTFNQNA